MSASVGALIRQLSAIREVLVAAETLWPEGRSGVPETHRQSARNLLHYLALRRQDIRPLQEELAELGLSSLGRSEAHALASMDAVLRVLHRLGRRRWRAPSDPGVGFAAGDALLKRHTEALLGPEPAARDARIMVTMPAEAATDFELVRALLAGGMDCMRINCAHDAAGAWAAMIANLRRAEQALGGSCRVLMDLAGPKLRTGPLEPGPQVVKVRPQRDSRGRVTAPARIWLTGIASPVPAPAPAVAAVPVPDQWLAALRPGDEVRFTDARGRRRTLTICAPEGDEERGGVTPGRWAESHKTAYIVTGTLLWVKDRPGKDGPGKESRRARKGSGRVRISPLSDGVAAKARLTLPGARTADKGGKRGAAHRARPATVGQLPPTEQFLLLKPGDTLVLTRELRPGRPASFSADGRLDSPATIGCTLPEVFGAARTGQSIWLDDGKIGGVIRSVDAGEMRVEITRARPGGTRLRAEKGINLPDTDLPVGALTEKDLADLPFIAANADMVGLSFVRLPQSVHELQSHLQRLGSQAGIVLKIETRRAFEQLPLLVLAAMRSPAAGVMIARGDLAIETGYERLAEVQEEILWLAEAAHLPVIWATQVLETLAKTGQPTRAEITDAAMAERAECVMLNKGPHIVEALQTLDDILQRMGEHQSKKVALLRQLRAWTHLTPVSAGNPE